MPQSTRRILSISASCACGQTSVRIEGPVLSMFLCACHDCQRATGTGHATVAMVPSSALTVIGSLATFTRPAESGAILSRHFCPGCGTPLYSQSSRAPDIRLVPVGLFAGQNDWFAPRHLIFALRHQDWDTIGADIPQHQRYPVRSGS